MHSNSIDDGDTCGKNYGMKFSSTMICSFTKKERFSTIEMKKYGVILHDQMYFMQLNKDLTLNLAMIIH